MKANKFLAYLAIVIVGCGFAVSCDDNDEPENPYYNDMVVYTDARTDAERQGDTDEFLDFTWGAFNGYRVEITRYADGGTYKIFIPATSIEMNLSSEYQMYEKMKLCPDATILVDNNPIQLSETTENYEEDDFEYIRHIYNSDYLSITYKHRATCDQNSSLKFVVAENTGAEREIKVKVENLGDNYEVAEIIFIQAGK